MSRRTRIYMFNLGGLCALVGLGLIIELIVSPDQSVVSSKGVLAALLMAAGYRVITTARQV